MSNLVKLIHFNLILQKSGQLIWIRVLYGSFKFQKQQKHGKFDECIAKHTNY